MIEYKTVLRRAAVLPAALALVAAVAAWQPVAAAPTDAQLQAAVVTADDLGPGFRQTLGNAIREPIGYTARFEREAGSTREIVVVLLQDAAAGSIRDTALAYFAGLQQTGPQGGGPEVAVAEVEAPAVGEEAVLYAYSLAFVGRNERNEAVPFFLRGEVMVWKQGEVVAMIGTLGTDQSTAGGYVAAQQDRLQRTLS